MPRWKDKDSNAHKAYSFFVEKGLQPYQAAALIGNFMQESNLKSDITNSIGAFGIAQWLGSRKTGLHNYAKKKGTSASNLNTQLEWVWQEFNTTEKRAFQKLQSSKDLAGATLAVRKYYERPGKHEAADSKRLNYAAQAFKQYSGQPVSVPVSSDIDGLGDFKGNFTTLDLPQNINVDFSFLPNTDNDLLNTTASQAGGMEQFMQEMSKLATLQSEEQKQKEEELRNNQYKAVLQEKINQRNFLAELVSNSDVKFVEKRKNQVIG